MKTKIISLILAGSLVGSQTAMATVYQTDCINQKGKFIGCKVGVEANALMVEYKNKKEKELNVSIPGEKITAINAGAFSKRNVAAGILLSPAFFLTKRKKTQISVEYLSENDKKGSVIFQAKEQYGIPLKSQLQVLSGKTVKNEDTKDVNLGL